MRREIWENRSIYLGPLIFAGFVLLGFMFRLHDLPGAEARGACCSSRPSAGRHRDALRRGDRNAGCRGVPVGAFYCLDALYGERRERSILFWKSLPVSDLTTVLSKITIPLVVLPVICMALSFCVHLIWLLVSSIVLLIGGVSPATTFAHVPLFQLWIAMIYSWLAVVLWHAPIYSWLLLVSSWARKAPFLWAVLPFVAIGIFERIAFGSQYVTSFVRYRVVGWFYQAIGRYATRRPPFSTPSRSSTPGRYLATPGLWLGLCFAARLLRRCPAAPLSRSCLIQPFTQRSDQPDSPSRYENHADSHVIAAFSLAASAFAAENADAH